MRAHAVLAGLASLLLAAPGCGSDAASTSSSTGTGGAGGAGGAPPTRPDPVVNEQKTHPAPIVDDAYRLR